jgi:hypothetical protein
MKKSRQKWLRNKAKKIGRRLAAAKVSPITAGRCSLTKSLRSVRISSLSRSTPSTT